VELVEQAQAEKGDRARIADRIARRAHHRGVGWPRQRLDDPGSKRSH